MLEVDDLHVYYGASHVIQGVSLKLAAGEFVGIIGRNGAGKTTLLHGLMGLLRPRRGSVRQNGLDLSNSPPFEHAEAGLALVPQGRRVFASLSVDEHLRVARPSLTASRRWTRADVLDLFPRLAQRLRNRGDELSGGEQQMLAIGRALMQSPSVLMLDEPTEGLAPLMVKELGQLLRRLGDEGLGILLVEQNLRFVLGLAGRVAIMSRGSIVHTDTAAKLLEDPNLQSQYFKL